MVDRPPHRLPRLPRLLADRPRLLRRLDRMAPLTHVEGLPGQGKTTLVAHWARRASDDGLAVTWVDGAAAGRGAAGADLESVVRDARTDVLVIDDADELPQDALDQLVELAIGTDLAVVVVARAARRVEEAVRRHRVDVTSIHGRDLMIDVDEVAAFADAWGHEVTSDHAVSLHRLVGGWLLPLRLVLDATPLGRTTPTTHAAREFMEESVIPQVADRCGLEVAVRLAVPELLTPDLADALLGLPPAFQGPGTSGEHVVGELERQGLATRAPDHPDPHDHWQLPDLVRRTLRGRLHATAPTVAQASHRTVARRLIDEGGPSAVGSAMRHARRGADWRLLARLWAGDGWQLAVAAPADFVAAYGDLPDEALDTAPSLRLPCALADGLPRGGGPAALVVKRRYVQLGFDELGRLGGVVDADERFEALLAGLGARRAAGRLAEAQQVAAALEAGLGRSGGGADVGMVRVQRARLLFERGLSAFRTGDVPTCLEQLTAVHETRRTGLLAAQSAALMAMVHALVGTVDEARRWLRATDASVAGDAGLQELTSTAALVARAMLALDRLDGDAAREALDRAGDGVEQVDLWVPVVVARTRWALHFGDPWKMLAHIDLVATTHAEVLRHDDVAASVLDRCRADLLLALGEVNRVRPLVRRGMDVPGWLRLPAARLHLMTGEPAHAARVASAGAWAPETPVRDRVDQLVVKAAALLASGSDTEAGHAFARAHALASAAGNLTPYLGVTPGVVRQLAERSGVAPEVVEGALSSAARAPFPARAELVELTPREAEVLRQMRRHETAAGVARSLSVSVNTVKKQMVSLYAKLGVHDRTSALLRAERLGLLDDPSGPRTEPPRVRSS